MKYNELSSDLKPCRLLGHSINVIIKCGCVLAFIMIAILQRRKYYRNEDATIFSVKQFQGMGWLYFPAITLCFSNGQYTVSEALFNVTAIRNELNLSVSEYGYALLGSKDYDNMMGIIWTQVTAMAIKKYWVSKVRNESIEPPNSGNFTDSLRRRHH